MGKRTDYFDDPAAPAANSLKPSAGCFVTDDQGRVLLIRRDDNGDWSMPGGAMDPGESLTGCAVRETREEAGVEVEVTGVGGIWTDPRHVIHYSSNDEVRQEFTVIYRARYVSGEPSTSSESTSVEWVPATDVPGLQLDRSQRLRLEWLLTHPAGTYHDPS